MTVAQKCAGEQQAVINKFLFGSASTILYSDLWVMVVVSGVVFAIIGILFKEFTLFIFDPLLAQSVGYPIKYFDLLFNLLLITTIVVGLQTIGVILMSTMLVAPAAAARQWTHRICPMIIVAVLIAIICSLSGVMISGSINQMPTGPIIVVLLSSIVFFSVFCAPKLQKIFMRVAQ
jgi:manganese/zinc/iron transport system permease protein